MIQNAKSINKTLKRNLRALRDNISSTNIRSLILKKQKKQNIFDEL